MQISTDINTECELFEKTRPIAQLSKHTGARRCTGSSLGARRSSRHAYLGPMGATPLRRQASPSVSTCHTKGGSCSAFQENLGRTVSSDPKHTAMLVRNSSAVLKDLCWRGPSGQTVLKRLSAARYYDLSRRHFSVSRPRWIKTADMKESDLAAVKVDGQRLMDTLHHTCKFGTGLRWGR